MFEDCLFDSMAIKPTPWRGIRYEARTAVLFYELDINDISCFDIWTLLSTAFITQSIPYFILSFILCYHWDTNLGQRKGNRAKQIQPMPFPFSGITEKGSYTWEQDLKYSVTERNVWVFCNQLVTESRLFRSHLVLLLGCKRELILADSPDILVKLLPF